MSLNSFLSPRLISNRAKFRKEWIGRFKNLPNVTFTARNFTTAKEAGRYNVAISCAWRGIPNKLTKRFPDRAFHVFIAKYVFKCWHQLLVTLMYITFTYLSLIFHEHFISRVFSIAGCFRAPYPVSYPEVGVSYAEQW